MTAMTPLLTTYLIVFALLCFSVVAFVYTLELGGEIKALRARVKKLEEGDDEC